MSTHALPHTVLTTFPSRTSQIIPRAIDYFTGKALEYDDMGLDSEDDEDIEEFDEDDEDEDDEDAEEVGHLP